MPHDGPRERHRQPHSEDDFADITGGDRHEETIEPSREDASSLYKKYVWLAQGMNRFLNSNAADRLKWQNHDRKVIRRFPWSERDEKNSKDKLTTVPRRLNEALDTLQRGYKSVTQTTGNLLGNRKPLTQEEKKALIHRYELIRRQLNCLIREWQKEVFRRQTNGIFSFIHENRKEIAGALAVIGVIIGIGVFLGKRQERKEAEALTRCTALPTISLGTRLALRDGKLDPESLSSIPIHDPETHNHEARLKFSERRSYSQGTREGGITIHVDDPDCTGGDVLYEMSATIGPKPKEYTFEARRE